MFLGTVVNKNNSLISFSMASFETYSLSNFQIGSEVLLTVVPGYSPSLGAHWRCQSFVGWVDCEYFLPYCGLSFHLFTESCTQFSIYVYLFCFVFMMLLVKSKNTLPCLRSSRSPVLSLGFHSVTVHMWVQGPLLSPGRESGWRLFLCRWTSDCSGAIFRKGHPSPTRLHLCLCPTRARHICVGLFLGSPLWSVPLSPCQCHIVLVTVVT